MVIVPPVDVNEPATGSSPLDPITSSPSFSGPTTFKGEDEPPITIA